MRHLLCALRAGPLSKLSVAFRFSFNEVRCLADDTPGKLGLENDAVFDVGSPRDLGDVVSRLGAWHPLALSWGHCCPNGGWHLWSARGKR